MAEYTKILDLVLEATEEAFRQKEINNEGSSIQPDTALFGLNGHLDSLALVYLVLDVEQRVEESLGVPIILTDDRAMSQRRSPFRTVESLAQYVHSQVNETINV